MRPTPTKMPRLLPAVLIALAVGLVGASLAWACTPDGYDDDPPAPAGPPPDPATPPSSSAPPPSGQSTPSPSTAPAPNGVASPSGNNAVVIEGQAEEITSSSPASSRRSAGNRVAPAVMQSGATSRASAGSAGAADGSAAPRSGDRSEKRAARAAASASERSIASDPNGRWLRSPTVANTDLPAAPPQSGRLGVGFGLLMLGLVGLSGVLLAGVSRRRRAATARSPRS